MNLKNELKTYNARNEQADNNTQFKHFRKLTECIRDMGTPFLSSFHSIPKTRFQIEMNESQTYVLFFILLYFSLIFSSS